MVDFGQETNNNDIDGLGNEKASMATEVESAGIPVRLSGVSGRPRVCCENVLVVGGGDA